MFCRVTDAISISRDGIDRLIDWRFAATIGVVLVRDKTISYKTRQVRYWNAVVLWSE